MHRLGRIHLTHWDNRHDISNHIGRRTACWGQSAASVIENSTLARSGFKQTPPLRLQALRPRRLHFPRAYLSSSRRRRGGEFAGTRSLARLSALPSPALMSTLALHGGNTRRHPRVRSAAGCAVARWELAGPYGGAEATPRLVKYCCGPLPPLEARGRHKDAVVRKVRLLCAQRWRAARLWRAGPLAGTKAHVRRHLLNAPHQRSATPLAAVQKIL